MSEDRTLLERQMQQVELRPFTLDGFHRQRSRRQRNRRIGAAVVALAVAVVAIGGLLRAISSEGVPAEEPAPTPADLGIFAPLAGRIVYHANSGLWGVDPNAPSPISTLVRVDLGGTADADQLASFTWPLGWSSDGTKLLFLREDPTDDTFPYDRHLYILHADGTETQVVPEPVGGAAISLDGSRVVFAGDGGDDGLYVVDADGGRPVRVSPFGEEPTFSPDGTQIAFLGLPRSGCCVPARREHVWVMNTDGTDAHEILLDEPALDGGANGLTWSPAGDRIAMDGARERHDAIFTFAPDGSGFTQVVRGALSPHWSPDGSQIAYTLECSDTSCGGLAIVDADGSNVRSLGVDKAGPWHPGAIQDATEAPASPSPSASPDPASATGVTSFASTIHGISIDPPSVWETRPATESWAGEPLDFDSPAADVLFHPELGEGLYMVVASQPYGELSQDEWRNRAVDWLCRPSEGSAAGSWTVDGADAFVLTCGSTASAALIFTDGRGYVIRLVVSSEVPFADAYDWDWHKVVLETVDLRPEEALDVPSPSESP